jgi:hypothetical protein
LETQKVLNVILKGAQSAEEERERIEKWFDDAMDNVSGWYKRKSQWVIVAIALIVTLLLNVDAMLILQHLNTQSALRDTVVAQAKGFADSRSAAVRVTAAGEPAAANVNAAPVPGMAEDARTLGAELDKLKLPIGWYLPSQAAGNGSLTAFRNENRLVLQTTGWADTLNFHIVGWLLTALAASLGAPFWFDTLNKFMAVRAAGKAPEERPKAPKAVPTPLGPGQSPRDAITVAQGH